MNAVSSSCVAALAAVVCLAGLPASAPAAVADECADAPQPTLCHGAAVLRRDLTPVPAAAVDAAAAGPTTRALAFQHRLGDTVPFADAPWLGTHNSFNTPAQVGTTPSSLDSNQRVGLVDQLRLGVRSLEVDVHLVGGRPVVCHGAELHAGCTIERPLRPVLDEVAAWSRAHRDDVLLLYLEDHLDSEAGYAEGARQVREAFGDLLFAPAAGEADCRSLPLDLTRRAVRAAGRSVVAIGNCGTGRAWPGVVHDFGKIKDERRPEGGDPCAPAPEADKPIFRVFEDSTFVTQGGSEAGATTADQGLTPDTVRALLGCGVDLLGFDQLLPGDPRLDAAVWSWAPDEPRAASCTMQLATGRWATSSCQRRRRAACATRAGGWVVPRGTAVQARARALCRRAGGRFAAPRTGRENAELRAAAGTRTVWLPVTR